VAGVAGAALLGLSVALIWTLHGSPATASTSGGTATPSVTTATTPSSGVGSTVGTGTSPPASAASQGQSLLTSAGMRGMISAVRPTMGGTKIVTMTVYPGYADIEYPTKADPKLYNDLTYRGGAIDDQPGGTVDSTNGILDLDTVNWDALPALITYADAHLKVAHPKDRYLIVEGNWFDEGPAVLVYVSDDYGGGYLVSNLKGKVVQTFPAER
jgi:hypothetical protein